MNPDRIEEMKKRPALKKSPYARAAKPRPDAPVPSPEVDPGRTQPNAIFFDDPFNTSLEIPGDFARAVPPYGGPGSFDKSGAKLEQSAGQEKSRAAYKTPTEYYSQLETVMGSPLMQKLNQGIGNMGKLREEFLKSNPVQTDLSPIMALADYLSDKPGKAQAGYKRPDDYNELVTKLSSLMQNEQSAAYNVANLAHNQVPLKAGEDTASTKAGVGKSRDTGFSVPRPPSMGTGMMNPLNQALGIQRAFQGLKPYKEAEAMLTDAQGIMQTVKNPNWLADNNLRGQMLQAMKLSPISEKEMAQFGTGDPSLFNHIRNMATKIGTGRSLSPQDYKAIEAFARAKADYAQKKMGIIQEQFVTGLGPYAPAFSSEGIRGLTQPTIPPNVDGGPKEETDDDKAFKAIMGIK